MTLDDIGYGAGDGFKGWNCRHDWAPFIPGVSVPTYTQEELRNIDPPPIEYNGKTYTYYEATQRQRQIETAIRKTKREIIAADGAGLKDDLTAKSVLLRRQKEEYINFSSAAGLRAKTERTGVLNYGRSISQKAVWTETRFTKQQEHAKILAEIKEKTGIRGDLHIPARNIDISALSFDSAHINKERGRDITLEEAKGFIKTAKASVTVWAGKFERYYSEKGASYVDIEQHRIRTAFRCEQYSDSVRKIIRELDKHEY